MSQKELIHRLKIAVSNISKNPKTAARVACLLEDFVASIEEIARDLEVNSDKQVAKELEEIVAALLEVE